jgi:hypothetical protein
MFEDVRNITQLYIKDIYDYSARIASLSAEDHKLITKFEGATTKDFFEGGYTSWRYAGSIVEKNMSINTAKAPEDFTMEDLIDELNKPLVKLHFLKRYAACLLLEKDPHTYRRNARMQEAKDIFLKEGSDEEEMIKRIVKQQLPDTMTSEYYHGVFYGAAIACSEIISKYRELTLESIASGTRSVQSIILECAKIIELQTIYCAYEYLQKEDDDWEFGDGEITFEDL